MNRYTGETILVECGKCESCLLKKSLAKKVKCQLESASHKYCVFGTLTFDNKHLPLVQLVNVDYNKNPNRYYVFRHRSNIRGKPVYGDGTLLGTIEFRKDVDKYQLMKKCNISTNPNVFPVLDTNDIQLFFKRLRKKVNEKIRTFYCGEYGPVHFRPHWHFLLWFDEDETLSTIHEDIRSCWSFGRVDSSLSFGKCNSYVASYLNSNCYLPEIFKLPGAAPVSNHSLYLGESVFEDTNKIETEADFATIVSRRYFGHGINTDVVLWRSLKTRLAPKCKGYMLQSEQLRSVAYKAYATVRSWTKEDRPLQQARFITDYVRFFDFWHQEEEISELLQVLRQGLNYFEERDGVKYYVKPYLSDYDKFERSVYKMLLLSRHFIVNICKNDINRVPEKLRLIDQFYKFLDYENLKNQLSLQETESKKSDYVGNYFFHNKFVVEDLKNEPIFKRFSQSRKKMYADFAKHKELNDKNKIFC